MVNHPNRSRKIKIGDRVEAGSGDEYDTGVVLRKLDGPGKCDVEVGWDSGVKTPAISAELRRL